MSHHGEDDDDGTEVLEVSRAVRMVECPLRMGQRPLVDGVAQVTNSSHQNDNRQQLEDERQSNTQLGNLLHSQSYRRLGNFHS